VNNAKISKLVSSLYNGYMVLGQRTFQYDRSKHAYRAIGLTPNNRPNASAHSSVRFASEIDLLGLRSRLDT